MTYTMRAFNPLESKCDSDPGRAIQPHGCLLICDADLAVIRSHSLNASELLGLPVGAINNRPLRDLFGNRVHELRNALARSNTPGRPGVVFGVPVGPAGKAWDIAVYAGNDAAIIEMEPAVEDCPSPLEMVRSLVGRLNQTEDEQQLLNMAARLLRGLFRYDRVMVCRFDHDGGGEIVAEARRGDLPPWLGMHCPTDIILAGSRFTPDALRVIYDARADMVPVELLTGDGGKPCDLSRANLFAAAPRDHERMLEINVVAALSIPLVMRGSLWGGVICHHYESKPLSMAKCIAAQMFGEYLSLHLDAVRRRMAAVSVHQTRSALDRLIKNISMHPNLTTQLKEKIADLHELIPSDGVGIWIEGIWASHGSAPPAKAIPALSRFVNGVARGQVWATHRLAVEFPTASEFAGVASGLIAIPLSQLPRDYLFFFRKEQGRAASWRGIPGAEPDSANQASPWSEIDLEVAAAVRNTMLEIVIRHNELVVADWRQSQLHQKMLNEELNHRVKNILALIKSLVSRPVDTTRSIQDYVAALSGRVQALAYAHDQAVGDGGGALRDLLNAELSPYRDQPNRITLEGPDVVLNASAFSVVALVIHELATNAVKYGALSAKDGQLTVCWQAPGKLSGCEILWTETGCPLLAPPSHQGFGTALITRSIPFSLGGESKIEYASTGVKARLLIPAAYVSPLLPGQSATITSDVSTPVPTEGAAKDKPLDGRRVLLVEDQLIIAMDVENMLMQLGASVVDSAAGAAEALRKLSLAAPDVAVLDINLGSGTSLTVAEALAERRIPFVFATGYGETQIIAGRMASVPLVRKPYEINALAAALARCIAVYAME